MPRPDRFAPSRAGVINLWDYRDEEFVFVDGWLVLRGPNGSGKTKALEVLFPFVLDGRIEPRRLNPFASEDRTMKSNLLYRGQDASHAYAWMEFHRPGSLDFVTIGVGLRAHRHVDRVTRWHFVVEGRAGVDFSLIDDDDRPLNRRDLIRELGAEHVYETPEEYRRAVDTRLFGLGPARYEQLLDLVLTLRKPQLAKDLNPVELSRTLQRGLRPLDDALLIEAASSFDDMEAVARTLEGLIAADEATSSFLSIYSTYLRTHAKAAADALTARREAVRRGQADLADAGAATEAAQRSYEAAAAGPAEANGIPGRLRAHLDRLKSSTAYQSHEQLADLERHVQDLARAVTRAEQIAVRDQSVVDRAVREERAAREAAADAAAAVARLARELAGEAETAGISWLDSDGAAEGFSARVSARVTARREDVRAVRDHAARLAQAERDHAKAAQDAAAAAEETAEAERAEEAAETAVSVARQRIRAAVRDWCGNQVSLLDELGVVEGPAALDAVIDRVGEPGAPALKEVFASLTQVGTSLLRDRAAELSADRNALAGRRDAIAAERDRIAAEHDDAPVPLATRPADRTGRAGAPLWRLVRFADGVEGEQAAGVEAALEAAGLLDAWIQPGADPVEQDGYLFPLPLQSRPAGPTLAGLLVPEDQADVPSQAIQEILASIAVRDSMEPSFATVGAGGQYAQGILLGTYTKPAAGYIGATARAARRAARVAECQRQIAALDAEIATVEAEREAIRRTLSNADTAAGALPSLEPIQAALRDLGLAANTLRLRREQQVTAAARLDQVIAEQAAAVAVLRKIVAERSLPVEQADAVADAVRRFETAALRLEPARRAAAGAQEALAGAQARQREAAERLEDAQTAIQDAMLRHQEKLEAFQTLSAAIGDTDVQRILAEVAETEQEITRAETRLERLREQVTEAREEQAAARTRAEAATAALEVAAAEARHESLSLRPFAHADLLSLLRCPTGLHWPSPEAGFEGTPQNELPEEVLALHEAILSATKELTPTEVSLKQSQTRLNTALNELQNQLPAAGLDHRPEFGYDDRVIVVRIADEQGLTPVAFFAERIARERHDQEQLLSDAERRILEDALLTQLARQIHHRTIEARDLVERMDQQMRARRMSSGLTVGVGWQLSDDLDPEQREVCKLLERDPARLGPGQLTTMRRHFATRIKAARAVAPEQPYRELLASVLDYRQWRIFAFTLHRPGGGSEALTRSRHSQLSGGEQSVSLHLPLFAAANALFSSARADAPRLLGLDEAFAGVDDNGRGELMSLATQFDLDLFMTGFDLWATHPAVTGAAHYDLSHSAVEHTVSTVLLAWNGSVTTADFDGTLARALGSPETRRSASLSGREIEVG